MISVHVLQTGTVTVRPGQLEGKGWARRLRPLIETAWSAPLPIFAFLILHPEGPFLVDTGMSPRVAEKAYLPAWHPYFRRAVRFAVAEEEAIDVKLKAFGVSPRDLRGVVLTHLHIDHMAGLAHLPPLPVWLSRLEWRMAQGLAGMIRGYLLGRLPEAFRPSFFRFEDPSPPPFPRAMALTADRRVLVLPTPGHSAGHVSVLVETDRGYVLIAGDASYTERAMQAGTIDGVAASSYSARLSLHRIRVFCRHFETAYLPAHDPETPARLAALG
jgi:N-acyl homoserine lactone hydrolase